MAAPVGGLIGPYSFYSLEGTITRSQRMYRSIKQPYEDGIAYSELGTMAPIARLVGKIDLVTANGPAITMDGYITLKGLVQTVSLPVGNAFLVAYPNMFILEVTDVTPSDAKYGSPVSGGLNAGAFWLWSEWLMQYALPT